MKNSLFISIFVLVLSSCSPFPYSRVLKKSTAVLPNRFASMKAKRFKAKITYKNFEITGILICKQINDSTLAGGLMNEFGIKGFDFTITNQRAKMSYLIKNLDKWYIRRKLEQDLHFMFAHPKPLGVCAIRDTLVNVATVSKRLHYVYYGSDQSKLDRADLYDGSKVVAHLRQFVNESSENVLKMQYVDGSLAYEFCEMGE